MKSGLLSQMKLPDSHCAVVERGKVTNYPLSASSPRGKSKANFFVRFGFSASNWQAFVNALKLQGANGEVVEITETVYGLRYEVSGTIETPDGRNPRIKTVWQYNTGTDYPQLITALPLGRGRQNGV